MAERKKKPNLQPAPKDLANTLLEQLVAQAGPRGTTFMGRHVGQMTGGAPDAESLVQQRTPTDVPDAEGFGIIDSLVKAGIPLSFWKGMTPEAKTMVTKYANKFPVSFSKVQEVPDLLSVNIKKPEGGYGNVTRNQFNPFIREMNIGPGFEKTNVVPHEFAHHIQNQRVAATDPLDAETIGTLLQSVLHEQGKKAPSIEYAKSMISGGTPSVDLDLKHWSKASPAMKDWLETVDRRRNTMPGHDKSIQPAKHPYGYETKTYLDAVQRLVMDEGLAHLADSSASKTSPSILKLLAARLGVLPE